MNNTEYRMKCTHKLGLPSISKFPDSGYSETKSLLFKFKANRLTERKATIPNILFDQPFDEPTIYEISEVKNYKHACPHIIWEDDITFSDFSRRMTARYNANLYNNFKTLRKI